MIDGKEEGDCCTDKKQKTDDNWYSLFLLQNDEIDKHHKLDDGSGKKRTSAFGHSHNSIEEQIEEDIQRIVLSLCC